MKEEISGGLTSPDSCAEQAQTGDLPGCLLIHGYGGSPFEMEGLAAALKGAGFPVRNICLPGHDESRTGFGKCRFNHWLAFAEKELRDMLAAHRAVVLAGFSLGGTLALNLGARFPVAAIVTLSTPVYILNVLPWPVQNARFYGASLFSRLEKFIPRTPAPSGSGAVETSRDIAPWKGYEGALNIPQLFSLRSGCAATRELLPHLHVPLLIMHDAHDKLVFPGNAFAIARMTASLDTTIMMTRIQEKITRHHMITTHRETARFVAEKTIGFFREKTLDLAAGVCLYK